MIDWKKALTAGAAIVTIAAGLLAIYNFAKAQGGQYSIRTAAIGSRSHGKVPVW